MFKIIRKLTKEEKREIAGKTRRAGYSSKKNIAIGELYRHNRGLYNYLKRRGRSIGTNNISHLLTESGFDAGQTRDIRAELIKELKNEFPLSRVREIVKRGPQTPKKSGLISLKKVICRYKSKRVKCKDLPPTRKIIDSLYAQHPHLSFYLTGQVKAGDFTPTEMGSTLRDVYFTGGDISCTGLQQREFGLYWRWLTAHAKMQSENLFGQDKRNLTKIVEELSNIRAADFSIKHAKETKTLGNISENLTRTILWSTLVLDQFGKRQTNAFKRCYPLPFSDIFPVYGREQGLKCEHAPAQEGDKELYADAVIRSLDELCYVEVKNFTTAHGNVLSELKGKICSERVLFWNKGDRDVTRKTLVVHSTDKVYRDVVDSLKGEDLSFVSPSEFRKSLEITLRDLESSGYTTPQVYSAEQILKAYDIIAERPHILIRPSHEQEFKFINDVTKDLLTKLQRGYRANGYKPITVFSRKGRLIENSEGTFQLFKLPLQNLPDSNVKAQVMKRMDDLHPGKLFMDIETMGFHGKQIFLIGTMYNSGRDITAELAFARNPLEERAVLKHFCAQAQNYDEVITYNGKSFDYPAIKKRLVSNRMSDTLPDKHTDYYRVLMKTGIYKKTNSARLSELYKLFGEEREDISSAEVPQRYLDWMKHGSAEAINDEIEHNVLDLLTMAAVYLSPNLLKGRKI
ncbi:ribonuclease H-like domain-containing protein [Nanoarchaeota archaeon]